MKRRYLLVRGWLAWHLARPFLRAEAERCGAWQRTGDDRYWQGGWDALVNASRDMRFGRTAHDRESWPPPKETTDEA